MKKLVSLLLALVLVFAISSVALAATTVSTEAELKAALEDGGDVVLGADIALTAMITIPEGVTATLDLASYDITVAEQSSGRHYYAFDNLGTLTLKASGDGSVTARGIYNRGTMVVESGKYTAQDTNGGASIWNYADLTIKGGHFYVGHVGDSSDSVAPTTIYNDADATLKIDGGKIESKSKRNYAIISIGSLVINDATVIGTHGAVAVDAGTAEINGGTFNTDNFTDAVSGGDHALYASGGSLVVNGGSFDGACYGLAVWGDANVTVNAGSFDGDNKSFETNQPEDDNSISIVGGNFDDAGATRVDKFVPSNYDVDGDEVVVDTTVPTVAAIGTKEFATLQDAIKAAAPGDTVELLDDVTLPAMVKIEKEITIDGGSAKHSVTTSAKKAFEVYADATFQNIKIETTYSSSSDGRCVDTRKAVEITLDNVELVAKGTKSQPLTIGGSEDGTKVLVKDSSIDAGSTGYGIIVFVEADITVENSEITGYAAIYFKENDASGTVCNVTDGSTLKGVLHTGVTNDFGVVVFQCSDVEFNIEDSTITVPEGSIVDGVAYHCAFWMDTDTGLGTVVVKNNQVTVTNTTIEGEPIAYGDMVKEQAGENATDDMSSVTIISGSFPDDPDVEKYIAEGSELGEDGTVIVTKPEKPAAKRYDVNVAKAENGDVAVKGSASYDSGVIITATPHYGYEVGKVVVTDADGDEVKVTERADGTYSFSMPRGEVSIKVTFVPQGEAVKLVLTIGSKAVDVNGKVVANDVAPVIKNSRTFLPVRLIAENLGASVIWDEPAQRVAVMKGETTIELFIGKTTVLVNGQPAELEAPVFIENSRTYLPVRFIAEKLGADVEWNGATNEVTITGRK